MPDTPCDCTCHLGGPQAVCDVFGGCADLHHLQPAPEPDTALSRPARACLLCPPPRQAGHWRLATAAEAPPGSVPAPRRRIT